MPVTINRFHLFVSGVLEILLAFFDKLYTLINRILVFFDVMYCCAIPVLTQRLFTATSRTIVVCLRTTSAFQVFVLNAFLECAFSAAHQTRLNPENTLVLVGHYKPLFLTESLSWPLSVAGAVLSTFAVRAVCGLSGPENGFQRGHTRHVLTLVTIPKNHIENSKHKIPPLFSF